MGKDARTATQLDKINHLNLVLISLREIGRILITENDPAVLIDRICDILVRKRGYYNAWICLVDSENNVRQIAHAGFDDQFHKIVEQLNQKKFPQCIHNVMMTEQVFSVSDPNKDCPDCVLSKKYANRGALAVRLNHENHTYGFMVLSTPMELAIDDTEKSIVSEIANDIAFGFYRMDLEEKRRLAEKELLESKIRFQTLIENSLNCIVIIQNNNIVYSNPGLREVHGFMVRVFTPPDFQNIFPEDRERVISSYNDLLSGRHYHINMDFRYYPEIQKKGEARIRWALLSATVIDYLKIESVLINIMDITDSKEVENFLQIQDKMTSLGRVTAGIAHEIRNPLSGIYIYLKALKKICINLSDPAKVISIIDKIELASNKVESIVKRVMDFSRPGMPQFTMTNLNQYIDDISKLTAVTLRKNGIRFIKNLDENLPDCWAEPNLIEQVVFNIMTNAVEAMKDFQGEKIIELSTYANKNSITISVKDSGPGIPLSSHSKIFDPFYTTKTNSSGIGLSICHRIITDHGGALKLKSQETSGVEFLIELPLEKDGQVL